jgi:hypothetical protein
MPSNYKTNAQIKSVPPIPVHHPHRAGKSPGEIALAVAQKLQKKSAMASGGHGAKKVQNLQKVKNHTGKGTQ